MSFLDFVKHKDMMNENVQWMNEAFKASQFGKAKGLLLTLFKKEITKGFVGYLGIYDLKVDGNDCQSSVYFMNLHKNKLLQTMHQTKIIEMVNQYPFKNIFFIIML